MTIKGLDELKRKLERQFGEAEMKRRMQRELDAVVDTLVLPVVRAQAPAGDSSSPWRRGGVKRKGPMRDRVYRKHLRLHEGEVAAAFVGTKVSYTAVVVRGSKPHDIPNFFGRKGFTYHHPGAKKIPFFDRALKRGLPRQVANAMKTALMRP